MAARLAREDVCLYETYFIAEILGSTSFFTQCLQFFTTQDTSVSSQDDSPLSTPKWEILSPACLARQRMKVQPDNRDHSATDSSTFDAHEACDTIPGKKSTLITIQPLLQPVGEATDAQSPLSMPSSPPVNLVLPPPELRQESLHGALSSQESPHKDSLFQPPDETLDKDGEAPHSDDEAPHTDDASPDEAPHGDSFAEDMQLGQPADELEK